MVWDHLSSLRIFLKTALASDPTILMARHRRGWDQLPVWSGVHPQLEQFTLSTWKIHWYGMQKHSIKLFQSFLGKTSVKLLNLLRSHPIARRKLKSLKNTQKIIIGGNVLNIFVFEFLLTLGITSESHPPSKWPITTEIWISYKNYFPPVSPCSSTSLIKILST